MPRNKAEFRPRFSPTFSIFFPNFNSKFLFFLIQGNFVSMISYDLSVFLMISFAFPQFLFSELSFNLFFNFTFSSISQISYFFFWYTYFFSCNALTNFAFFQNFSYFLLLLLVFLLFYFVNLNFTSISQIL